MNMLGPNNMHSRSRIEMNQFQEPLVKKRIKPQNSTSSVLKLQNDITGIYKRHMVQWIRVLVKTEKNNIEFCTKSVILADLT